jgi:hypothetical protein
MWLRAISPKEFPFMKSPLTRSKTSLAGLVGALLLLLLSFCPAQAQILLTINDSDPSAVTITATGSFAGTGASDSFSNGIDLLGFFTSSVGFDMFNVTSVLTTGNLSPGAFYDTAYGDNLSFQNVDLSLYSSNQTATETFATGTPAFIGSMTLDLSGVGLPSVGTSGNIVTGYSMTAPDNTTIGQWQVLAVSTPEPSSWMLLLLGFALVAIFRTRLGRLGSKAKSAKQIE